MVITIEDLLIEAVQLICLFADIKKSMIKSNGNSKILSLVKVVLTNQPEHFSHPADLNSPNVVSRKIFFGNFITGILTDKTCFFEYNLQTHNVISALS